MKRYILFILSVFILGCATNQDLKRVQRCLGDEILEIRQDQFALRKDVEKYIEIGSSLRSSQAEIGADMVDLRDEVQELRGEIESLKRDVQTRCEDEGRSKQLSYISFRLNYIESFLGIEKKAEPAGGSGNREKGDIPSKATQEKKTDKEAFYVEAYRTFKEGKYDQATVKFQKFLKLFPQTEYSDNAQFWIGECYFLKGEYEKAILEYEKVIKNYPGGNKVSHALLKQGLAFLKIGDKPSAKLILQQVMRDFPNTNQARIARARLVEIK